MEKELVHTDFMRQVIELACQNLRRPFASIIVDEANGEVVAEGLNKSYRNPTLHSELVAIDHCSRVADADDWGNFTLYTIAEPNPMCMAGILWAGIPRVVFGSSRATLAKLGYRHIDVSAQQMIDQAVDISCELTGGILEKECNELFAAAIKLDQTS